MSRLALFLLGPPRVEREAERIKLSTRKATALLAYLALTRQRHSRDSLAALFWPEYDQAHAQAALRSTLWAANRALGKGWLELDREQVGLRQTAGCWVDALEFERLIAAQQAHDHPVPRLCAGCAAALATAVALYRDDLLAGFHLRDSLAFDDWRLFQAERLRHQLSEALERLTCWHSDQDELELAIGYAQRWTALDPLHEPAQRALIQLYARAGKRSAALRQYQLCARLLARELGELPQEATRLLYQSIKARRQPASASQTAPQLPVHNLPHYATPLLGREAELAQIHQLLREPGCRLLTLSGPGGIGKTRLAVQAASQLLESFKHGVYYVPLAALSSTAFLVQTIAECLQFAFYGREEPRRQLVNYLREKELLLVLDNFEHIIEAAALLAEMLREAPAVKLLVTTRERLSLHGEWLIAVDGLSFPRGGAAATLEEYSAARLFVQSAWRSEPHFRLPAAERAAVARICQLVQGLPLGIELAASWVRLLSCQEIASEIEQSLDFLASAQRDLPARHRSLRAVFDHSWRLLSTAERAALQRLAVFRGGFDRQAALAVAGAALPLLSALIDKSLLQRTAAGRYEAHELVRHYAGEQLAALPDEQQAARQDHARFYVACLQRGEEQLRGSGQKQALQALTTEIENLRAAWQWAIEQADGSLLDRALEPLYLFYDLRCWFREGDEAFGQASKALQPGQTPVYWRLLARQAAFCVRLGLYGEAERLFEQSLAGLRQASLPAEAAFCLDHLGGLAYLSGRYAQAATLLNESLAICRALQLPAGVARALNNLGNVAYGLGNYAQARQHYQESLAICQQLGDVSRVAVAYNNLGNLAFELGEYTEARQLHQQSLAIKQELGNSAGIAISLNNLGLVAYKLGEYAQARCLHEESLGLCRALGDQRGVARSLNNLGDAAQALGQDQAAAGHFRAALRTTMAVPAFPVALYGLTGMAALLLRQQQPAGAAELLAVVLAHPATDRETRNRAEQLLAEVQPLLTPEAQAACCRHGRLHSLEATVEQLQRQQTSGSSLLPQAYPDSTRLAEAHP